MPEPPPEPAGVAEPEGPLRVLVVDDERLGRKRVLDLLARETGVVVTDAVASGQEAIESIRRDAPDVVLLDVQMPDLTGLDVVRAVGPESMPVTVFVTAYDRHALAAFDLAALDYLLKPFDDARFRQALDRARTAVRLREVDRVRAHLAALLGDAAPAPSERPRYLDTITVEMRGQVRFVPVARVDYIEADGPYAEVHAGGETYLIREQMQALEARLDPAVFIRTHRSVIVRLDCVEALLVGSAGDYAVRLRDGAKLRVSRARRDVLAARLGYEPRG
ncbi:MAG TPA: LytTR family DNA-binding domain-containing protein [Rhodothermales bacterium]|nr:LytTR family DNA-binding domain-containing protein [Rhodothermales bacterium]